MRRTARGLAFARGIVIALAVTPAGARADAPAADRVLYRAPAEPAPSRDGRWLIAGGVVVLVAAFVLAARRRPATTIAPPPAADPPPATTEDRIDE